MRTPAHLVLLASTVALGFGCAAESVGDGSDAVRITTQCSVTAFGSLPSGDDFDGVGTGSADGFASGTWEHLGPPREDEGDEGDEPGEGCRGVRRGHEEDRGEGHDRHQGRGLGHECGCGDDDDDGTTRDRFVGDVEAVTCFINGVRLGVVQGSGEWNGEAGHTFEATVLEGDDDYSMSVYDATGTLVYEASGIADSGDMYLIEL